MPLRNATTGTVGSASVFHLLRQGWRERRLGAPAVVFPGRRAGRGGQLAGVWRVGSEADEVDRARRRRAPALWLGGQSRHPAWPGRPGFRESGRYGLEPARPAGPGAELLEYGHRYRFAGRVRAQLPGHLRPPELAALPGGRGLRHGAGGRPGRLSQRTPDPGHGVVSCSR